MSYKIVFTVIFSVLVLGLTGFTQDAEAVPMSFTTDTTISTDQTINGVWIVTPGVTLTINSGVTVTLQSDPISDLLLNTQGTIRNFGTINNAGGGILNTGGTINNSGTITSTGAIQNEATQQFSQIIDHATINNDGTIHNSGDITNGFGATINNDGTITNTGTLRIIGTGTMAGPGDIHNVGTGHITGASQVSCGAGTTLNTNTNECEADVTQAQLDACNASLITVTNELNSCNTELNTLQTNLQNLFDNNLCNPLADSIPNVLICISNFVDILSSLDRDGIADDIDLLPEEFSDDFTDELLNGTTSGSVTTRGDQNLSVLNDQDPSGVYIVTDSAGGDKPAIVNLCDDSANVSFDVDERAIATCGSVTIEVLKGTISTEFVNHRFDVTSDIQTGGIISYDKGILEICNLGSESAVVNVNGRIITILAGKCLDFTNKSSNEWNTRPTFGINHQTNQLLVDNGFRFNTEQFMVTDNHHTDFAEQPIQIGQTNSFSATVYAEKKLKVQEFLFGIPNVGESHLAELGVEVWYDLNGEIEDIKVIQKSDVIDADTISVTHEKSYCQVSDIEPRCDTTTVSMTFLEPLQDKVMAIKAIDWKNRDQRTYLNDGFDIVGESLNPMNTKMIPSNVKYEGLLQVTQMEKYSPYWTSDDGRTFEMNSFGSFKQTNQAFERFQDTGTAYTRAHSGFGGVMAYELKRATEVFDASVYISELPDFLPYAPPTTSERMTEEMNAKMLEQQQKAQEILDAMVKPQRNY